MLYDKLKAYADSGVYPMHMPGHKRNADLLPPGLPYDVDITEIHGFDDLHEPTGLLMETAELAAELYGSDKAFPLVNGSTVGILAAIGAHTVAGDKILTTRSCHRAVHNAAALFGLSPVYLSPGTDAETGIECSINPADVEAAFGEHPDIKLVVITSPTYEGVISDIRSIADVAHRHGATLFVDSAHGAHLGFGSEAYMFGGANGALPGINNNTEVQDGAGRCSLSDCAGTCFPCFHVNAITAGADVAVMSLHKTLPALTQCSLLHVRGDKANPGAVKKLLYTLQTSSPSYVLMASIDSCLRLLLADGARLFGDYEKNLREFSEKVKALKKLTVLCHGNDRPHPGFYAHDPGKLVIVTGDVTQAEATTSSMVQRRGTISGYTLMETLRCEFGIELELARDNYALAMTSICDTSAGFSRLADALLAIDRREW